MQISYQVQFALKLSEESDNIKLLFIVKNVRKLA